MTSARLSRLSCCGCTADEMLGPTSQSGDVAADLRFAAMDLRYLYVGSSDTGRDVAAWLAVPGAQVRWRFQHFGADVAAIDLGSPPTVLLADHRSPGSVLPIFAVAELAVVRDALERHGWTIEARSIGTPEGPAAVLHHISGTKIALLQVDRPAAMETAYASRDNVHAVRPDGSEGAGPDPSEPTA